MNQVILIGRLTRDVELSYTRSTQQPVAKFTLAVDKPRREGQDQGADFIRITVWGKQAETCERYLSKGRQAAVQGRIQTGSYTKDGVTVYTTDVVADRVEFLGGGQGGQSGQERGRGRAPRDNGRTGGSGNSRANNSYNNPDSRFGFNDFDDLPDTFEAAEDDIPF